MTQEEKEHLARTLLAINNRIDLLQESIVLGRQAMDSMHEAIKTLVVIVEDLNQRG